MGKFIDATTVKSRPAPRRPKTLQTCTMDVIIDTDEIADWAEVIGAWPEEYVMRVLHVDKWFAQAEISYTAKGANRTDISRRIVAAHPLQCLMGSTTTDVL